MESSFPPNDPASIRDQADQQPDIRTAIQNNRRTDAECRNGYQLRRCRPGRRTDPALGDAKGWL